MDLIVPCFPLLPSPQDPGDHFFFLRKYITTSHRLPLPSYPATGLALCLATPITSPIFTLSWLQHLLCLTCLYLTLFNPQTMLALDARFTLLVIFCGLATQWAAPGATVHAAAISRTTDYDQPGAHTQHVLPWSGKGRPGSSKARHEGGRKHNVVSLSLCFRVCGEADFSFFFSYFKRTNDYHPSNPFGRFIDRIIKRPHGHHKRSHKSILIPTNHGITYAVSHSRRDTPLWRVGRPAKEGGDKEDNTGRGEDVTEGYVTIMVRSLLSPFEVAFADADEKQSDLKTLAYLVVTRTANGEYVLNASENDKTLASLHKIPVAVKNAVSGTSGEIPVTLQIDPPTDSDSKNLAVSNPLCATYNPNPSQPQPMTVTDCVDQTSPGRTEKGSQTFLYNKDNGVIRPTWINGQDDGKTDTPAAAQAADFPSSSSSSASPSAGALNPTSTSSASAISPNDAAANGTQTSTGALTSSTPGLNSRAVMPAPAAQNVTLVFKPVNAVAADVDSSAIDTQNSTVAASETTTTMTRTVTVFSAQTASSSSTASDSAAAAASQSANSIGVELVSGTPAATIASSTSSAQALASASPSSGDASVVAASVTAAPSSSINAAAVASSLAASAAALRSSAATSAAPTNANANASASGTATPEAISSASASATSTASGSSSTFVAAVIEREAAPEPKLTGVSTAPYQWSFAAEER